jgi:hypothetical protein
MRLDFIRVHCVFMCKVLLAAEGLYSVVMCKVLLAAVVLLQRGYV